MGPIASALSGIAVAAMVRWSYAQLPLFIPALGNGGAADEEKDKDKKIKIASPTPFDKARVFYKSQSGKAARFGLAIFLAYFLVTSAVQFTAASKFYAVQISQPSLMFQTRLNNGESVIVDDYVVGYKWIKDHTPPDSRVLSWWDYGYQIAGIANRTTLADGNTWNLEHIALIGKILTSSQPEVRILVFSPSLHFSSRVFRHTSWRGT